MSTFADYRTDVVAKLIAAGVATATTNPRANPPAVIVGPISLDAAEGVGGWVGSLEVLCIAPPPADDRALSQLEDVAEVVLRTLGFGRLVPERVTHGAADVPAYSLTYPVRLTNPDC